MASGERSDAGGLWPDVAHPAAHCWGVSAPRDRQLPEAVDGRVDTQSLAPYCHQPSVRHVAGHNTSSFSPFPYLWSAHQVFNLHVLRSCASSIFTPFSFMSFLVTSLHLSFGLPIFRCPPTYMFSLLHLLLSFSPHARTISVLFLFIFSLCLPHAHTCPCSYFVIPDLLNPLYSHHPPHMSQHVFNVSILNSNW